MGNSSSTSTPSGACPSTSSTQPAAECPAQFRTSQPVYNVYGQRVEVGSTQQTALDKLTAYSMLDPTNNMPSEPNQQPFPGQRVPLPTDRQASTIPKGGTQSTWLYPSPQMFYNALQRKGKGDDVRPEDVEAVVYNHNVMNEATWQRVLAWEALHHADCDCPKLLKFQGKPDTQSPRATLRRALGDRTWFDRHDWWVDRCGTPVRYVIDFYFDEAKAGSMDAFEVDARPALDGPTAVVDRVKMAIYTTFAHWGLPCPVTGHRGDGAQPSAS